VADRGTMTFRAWPGDRAAWAAVADLPAVQRLAWFNRGFMSAWRDDDRLIVSDLRMGADNQFVFNFAVARRTGDAWQAIAPEQVRLPMDARRRLAAMWQRIWTAPDQDLAPAVPDQARALSAPDGSR
jgi:inner membrane protein